MFDIYIINKGVQSGPFNQTQAEDELKDYIEKHCYANLRQAMNDVTYGKGKVTGNYTYDGQPVLRTSSGNNQKSVSIFFYNTEDSYYIIAMGEHRTLTSYLLNGFGQTAGDFKFGKTINL